MLTDVDPGRAGTRLVASRVKATRNVECGRAVEPQAASAASPNPAARAPFGRTHAARAEVPAC